MVSGSYVQVHQDASSTLEAYRCGSGDSRRKASLDEHKQDVGRYVSTIMATSPSEESSGALKTWRSERGWDPVNPGRRLIDAGPCERLVIFNKRDLVPEWGIEVRINLLCVKSLIVLV